MYWMSDSPVPVRLYSSHARCDLGGTGEPGNEPRSWPCGGGGGSTLSFDASFLFAFCSQSLKKEVDISCVKLVILTWEEIRRWNVSFQNWPWSDYFHELWAEVISQQCHVRYMKYLRLWWSALLAFLTEGFDVGRSAITTKLQFEFNELY